MKRTAPSAARPQEFDFGPQVGQLWQLHNDHSIVMVTQVGHHDDFHNWLPNCIEYINVGSIDEGHDGAYWRVDFTHPAGGVFLDEYLEKQHGACDRCSFEPWTGRGVFFGTKHAAAVERLRAAQRRERAKKVRNIPRLLALDRRMAALFKRQLAPEGFQ